MYAIVDYKGNQILLKEGEKVKIPFVKDGKVGSTLIFENVLFFDDGKKKHTGNPFINGINLKAKLLSHEKDSKIIVFKQKRRKGYQKKRGYRDDYTLIQIDKLSSVKQKKETKATSSKTKKKSTSVKAKTTSSQTKKKTTSVKAKTNTSKTTKK